VSGKASERRLPRAAVFAVVVEVSDPGIEGLVEILKTLSAKAREEVAAHVAKPALDLAAALG
jgi:hypothetical protein